MKWYLKVLQNYVTFNGRARRSEYWFFVLFNAIFAIIAIILDNVLGTKIEFAGGISLPYGYIYLLYILAMIMPGLAVFVRRLHDCGKSGWMFFIVLIPIIGAIWLLILMFTDSNPGSNKYGANPKEIVAN